MSEHRYYPDPDIDRDLGLIVGKRQLLELDSAKRNRFVRRILLNEIRWAQYRIQLKANEIIKALGGGNER